MTFDLPGGIKNTLPGPLDSVMGPYPTIAEANRLVPNNIVDGVSYRMGKEVLIGIDGDFTKYKWEGPLFRDMDLVDITSVAKKIYDYVGIDSEIYTNTSADTQNCFVNRDAVAISDGIATTIKINGELPGGIWLIHFRKLGIEYTEISRHNLTVQTGVQQIDIRNFDIQVLIGDTFGIAYNGSRIRYLANYSATSSTRVVPLNSNGKFSFTDATFPNPSANPDKTAIPFIVTILKKIDVVTQIDENETSIKNLDKIVSDVSLKVGAQKSDLDLQKVALQLVTDSLYEETVALLAVENAPFNSSTAWKGAGFAGWSFGAVPPAGSEQIKSVRHRFSRVLQNEKLNFKIYKRPISKADSLIYPGFETGDVVIKNVDYLVSTLEQTDEFQYINFPIDLPVESGFLYLSLVVAIKAAGARGDLGSDSHANSATLYQFQRGFYVNGTSGNQTVISAATGRQPSGEFIFSKTVASNKLEKATAEISTLKDDTYTLKTEVSDLKNKPSTVPIGVYDQITDASIAIAGLSATIKFTFNRADTKASISQVLTIDSAAKVAGNTINGLSMPYQSLTRAVYGVPLKVGGYKVKNVSNLVVKRTSDSGVLAINTDYRFFPYQGAISGANSASGTISVNLTFDYEKERIDLVEYNPITNTIAVLKGTERTNDAGEAPYRPVKSVHGIPLFLLFVRGTAIDTVSVWDWEGRFKINNELELIRALEYNKSCLPKTFKKLYSGQPLKLGGYGDSQTDIREGGTPVFTANGVNRDRSGFLEFSAPDYLATLEKFDHGDGAGAVHIHIGWNYILKSFLEKKYGSAVTYNNYGIAGTTSEPTSNNGLWPARLAALIADANDLVVIGFGMNEAASLNVYSNVLSIAKQNIAAGSECIIMGLPRPNTIGGHSDISHFRSVNNQLKQAALDSGSAFIPVSYFMEDSRLGFMGLDGKSLCGTNLYNHELVWELKKYGEMLTMIF